MKESNTESNSRLSREAIARRMDTITIALDEGVALCDGDVDAFLSLMTTRHIHTLLDHLPTIAGPWRVVDMRRGEVVCMERRGYGGEAIARVKTVGTGHKAWISRVGDALIEHPENFTTGWATCDEARAACDAQLARDGVRLDDVGVRLDDVGETT